MIGFLLQTCQGSQQTDMCAALGNGARQYRLRLLQAIALGEEAARRQRGIGVVRVLCEQRQQMTQRLFVLAQALRDARQANERRNVPGLAHLRPAIGGASVFEVAIGQMQMTELRVRREVCRRQFGDALPICQ
jgi:hypothetical protein